MDHKAIAKKNMAGLFPESYAALYPQEAAAMKKAEQEQLTEVPGSVSETINNTTATSALWQTVWEGGWIDKTRKLMTDLRPLFTDVSSGFDVSNPVAMPVVKINVVNSVGSAMVDTADWETSAVNEAWVDCQSHRISVPFSLTMRELTYGTTIRSKVAAISTVSSMGIVKGYPDGDFHPNANITRAEFAAIAARFDKTAMAGGTYFSDAKIKIPRMPWVDPVYETGVNPEGAEVVQEVHNYLTYGNFISAIINFLILALVVFFLVKGLNKLTELGKK